MNGIINLYKPLGITSHGAVNRVRRIFSIKKVGHTGTLDPEADGVLPICVGKGTKLSGLLTDSDKAYRAVLRLGLVTDTQDAQGKVLVQNAVHISEDKFLEAVKLFIGEISQVPPMYSAIKQNGKKLYELARQGIEVPRQPRQVTIHDIEISEFDGEQAVLQVSCSKGTYIRTLCHDIGQKLGCGAIMQQLTRTASGRFRLEESISLEQLEEMKEKALVPVDQMFLDYPAYVADAEQEKRFRNGCTVPIPGVEIGKIYRVYSLDNEFLCLSTGVHPNNPCLKLQTAFF